MKVFTVIVGLVVMVKAETEQEKAARCKGVIKEFNDCTKKAHTNYAAAMKGGEDGREDFAARKACNYLQDAVETCGDKLKGGNCNSDEKVIEMKDKQIKTVLERLETNVSDWDSSKCPPVQAHIDRLKKAEEVKAAEMNPAPESEPQGSPEPEGSGDADPNSVSDLAASGVLLVTTLLLV